MAVAKYTLLTPSSTNALDHIYKFEMLNFRKSARTFHYERPKVKQIKAKESLEIWESFFNLIENLRRISLVW